MHFLALSALFLNAMAAPTATTCAIQRGKDGLVGTAFGGKSFSLGKSEILMSEKLGDVTLTVLSDLDSPFGYPVKNFKIRMSKGDQTETLEAYSEAQNYAKVTLTSVIKKGSTMSSSVAFSDDLGEYTETVVGLPVKYSVQFGPNGGVIHFDVNNKVSISLTNYGGRPFYNFVEIKHQGDAKITGGKCRA